jgi:hypothetical protein
MHLADLLRQLCLRVTHVRAATTGGHTRAAVGESGPPPACALRDRVKSSFDSCWQSAMQRGHACKRRVAASVALWFEILAARYFQLVPDSPAVRKLVVAGR